MCSSGLTGVDCVGAVFARAVLDFGYAIHLGEFNSILRRQGSGG